MTDTTGIFHKFRSLSELTNESKGGYIDWEFQVQTGIKTIEFELFTKEKTPHPHMLFITPFKKSREEKNKKKPNENRNMNARDYKVVLKMDENGDFKVQTPDYISDKTIELVGPDFWNSETRTIKLCKDGLRLTVVKAGQRQGQGKIKFLDEIMKERNIQKDSYEIGKVLLRAQFDVFNPYWTQVLVDKSKYLIQIKICTNNLICNSGEHVIFVTFDKASITTDKTEDLELILFQTENQTDFLSPRAISSDVYKDRDLFAFKVNMNNVMIGNAYVIVKLNDPDVPNPDITDAFSIKVMEHTPGEFCPCQNNEHHLNLFNKVTVTNGKKRNISDSSSVSSKKLCHNSPMTTSSTASELSPIQNFDGNFSPNGIIHQPENQGVNQNPIDLPLPSADVENEYLPDLNSQFSDLSGFLKTDGPHKKKQNLNSNCLQCRKVNPNLLYCAKKLSDFATKLSFVFDKKFLWFIFANFFLAGIFKISDKLYY